MTSTLPSAGDLLGGRYRLDHVLGRGGTGVVWRGYDLERDRAVAVKISAPPSHLGPDEAEVLRSRVLREARAAARLTDPAVVEVLDVVDSGDGIALVLELVDATTLAETVAVDGPLHPAVVARIGLDVLSALVCAHEQGILHRDVKPGNVLLQTDGRVRLADFGIASIEGDPSLTATGLLLGSPAYISPERARTGLATTDADLWSLAATLYTAVEGVPAYDGGDALATLVAITSGRRRPCRSAGELEAVLSAVLDVPAADRPDAAALRALLEPIAIEPVAAAPARPTHVAVDEPTMAMPLIEVPAAVEVAAAGEIPGAVVASVPDPDVDEVATPAESVAPAQSVAPAESVAPASADPGPLPALQALARREAQASGVVAVPPAAAPLQAPDLTRITEAVDTETDLVAERRRVLADEPTRADLPLAVAIPSAELPQVQVPAVVVPAAVVPAVVVPAAEVTVAEVPAVEVPAAESVAADPEADPDPDPQPEPLVGTEPAAEAAEAEPFTEAHTEMPTAPSSSTTQTMAVLASPPPAEAPERVDATQEPERVDATQEPVAAAAPVIETQPPVEAPFTQSPPPVEPQAPATPSEEVVDARQPRHARPSSRTIRKRRRTTAVVAVLGLAIVGLGVYRSVNTSSTSDNTASSTTAAKVVLPAGWVPLAEADNNDPWTAGTPAGWTVDTAVAGVTTLNQASTGASISVQVAPGATTSVVDRWKAADLDALKKRVGYSLVRIAATDGASGLTGADWEFTDGKGAGERHVLERGLVSGDVGYAITSQAPAAAWATVQPTALEFLKLFTPATATAGQPSASSATSTGPAVAATTAGH